MSAAGTTIAIAGATGVVGSGVVKAWHDAGATVIAISRSAERMQQAAEDLGIAGSDRLHIVAADPVDDASSDALAAQVKELLDGAPLGHVVSAAGFVTPAEGVTQTSIDLVRTSLDDGLYPNVGVARALLPLQVDADNPSFTLVSGGFAHGLPPMPGAEGLWLGTLKNAAVNAFTHGLNAEQGPDGVRVNTACIHVGVARAGADQNQLGMPVERDTHDLAPAFLALAMSDRRGEIVCLESWDVIDAIAGEVTATA